MRKLSSSFTSALELLQSLPGAPQRLEQELALRLGLGAALSPVKGWTAPEVGEVLARTRELCRQIGETPHLFRALRSATTSPVANSACSASAVVPRLPPAVAVADTDFGLPSGMTTASPWEHW